MLKNQPCQMRKKCINQLFVPPSHDQGSLGAILGFNGYDPIVGKDLGARFPAQIAFRAIPNEF